MTKHICKLILGLLMLVVAGALQADTTSSAALVPCSPLPTGKLTDQQLSRLVPEKSPGRVRIAWATETQTDTYGFNILRSDSPDDPYKPVNKTIIPGEGTTNVPSNYCFEESGLERGRVYYYQVEEITNAGARSIIPGTAASRIRVKSIAEERAWLKSKAEQGE